MSKISTSISATTDGTYGMINSLIGQIKTQILNDTNVSVISDNNPDNTTARVLVYSVASQAHYFKVYAASGTTLGVAILAIDGSTVIRSSTSGTISSGGSYNFHFVYNTKAHVWNLLTTTKLDLITINCGDAAGWYSSVILATTGTQWYRQDRDAYITCVFKDYGYLNSGALRGIPLGFVIDGNLSPYYHLYCWSSNTLFSNGFYTYDSADYLVLAATSNYGICIKDAVPD